MARAIILANFPLDSLIRIIIMRPMIAQAISNHLRRNPMMTKQKPGPKSEPLAYIPPQFREVQGVEVLTTVTQLQRLQEYLDTPQNERPAFVRLGASVPPPGTSNEARKPTATYAVDVDGQVRVFKRIQDPRAAHRWMTNPAREWNISASFCGKAANNEE
jgi:hypothetical protein